MFLLRTSNSSLREDETDLPCPSMKTAAMKQRCMTVHIKCETHLILICKLFGKNWNQELLLQ